MHAFVLCVLSLDTEAAAALCRAVFRNGFPFQAGLSVFFRWVAGENKG